MRVYLNNKFNYLGRRNILYIYIVKIDKLNKKFYYKEIEY